MLGPQVARDLLRVGRLVEFPLREADRERAYRPARALLHQRDHGARVDSPGEERTQRDVGDQAALDGGAQDLLELVDGCLEGLLRPGPFALIAQLPEAVSRHGSCLPHQCVAGEQPEGIGVEGLRARQPAQAQVGRECASLEPGTESGMGAKRAQLGSEAQHPCGPAVVQRLDARAIAREQQAAGRAVPERECEHSVQTRECIDAPGAVGLQHDLRIAVGTEGEPELFELGAQLAEVVDLAVVRDDERLVIGDHRLVTPLGEIEDRQARVSQRQRHAASAGVEARAPDARIIGAAVIERAGHGADIVDPRRRCRTDHTAEPAHGRAASHPPDPGESAASYSESPFWRETREA